MANARPDPSFSASAYMQDHTIRNSLFFNKQSTNPKIAKILENAESKYFQEQESKRKES